MSSDKIAIQVTDLSKRYEIYDRASDRLKQFILPKLGKLLGVSPKKYYKVFWALQDLSFEIQKGETVGILGKNGSGKSTLLQIISGILSPTHGEVKVNGRVAALLELGSGFNPEFTGRENIYLNATLLGLTGEEAKSRFSAIEDFADIGDFIDQPLKTYSSGMIVRLAFSVIANVNAEILIVDEALSVGDVFFAQKCMRFFDEHKKNGGTLLFVSHDMAAIKGLCSKVLLLESGAIKAAGEVDEVCKTYLKKLYEERSLDVGFKNEGESHSAQVVFRGDRSEKLEFRANYYPKNIIYISQFRSDAESIGNGGAKIIDAGFYDSFQKKIEFIKSEEQVTLCLQISALKKIELPAIGLVIKDRLGQEIVTESTTIPFKDIYIENNLIFFPGDNVKVSFEFIMPALYQGDYTMTLAIAEGFGHDHIQQHLVHDALSLKSIGNRLLHGIVGLNNVSMKIEVNRHE